MITESFPYVTFKLTYAPEHGSLHFVAEMHYQSLFLLY